MDNKHNLYNCWDHVRHERERIQSQKCTTLNRLEESWQLLQDDYGEPVRRDFDEEFADSPLQAFLYLVDEGFYPPPEVLLSIRHCFRHYMICSGDIELEDVFFSKRKKRVGNYAARSAHDSLYEQLWFLGRCEDLLSNEPNRSIETLAEEMLQNLKLYDYDTDNFLRNYRRWKQRVRDQKGKNIE